MPSIWAPPADTSWMQAIKVQLVTWLRDDVILEPLVAGRVYTVVPPQALYPLITIEGAAPRTSNTFRHAKRIVSLQVRAQSQETHEGELDAIGDRVVAIVEGQVTAPLATFRSATWQVDPTQSPPTYTDELANVVTRHRPVILLVHLTP